MNSSTRHPLAKLTMWSGLLAGAAGLVAISSAAYQLRLSLGTLESAGALAAIGAGTALLVLGALAAIKQRG